VRATNLGALAAVATTGFFSRTARHRALVVFTDGETRPLPPARLAVLFRRPPAIRPMFVQVWGGPSERIYSTGLPDPGYQPDPTSRETLGRLAAGIGGRTFSEQDPGAVAAAVQASLGSGSRTRVESREQQALAPYVLAAGIVPLAFLLWRRNAPRRRHAVRGLPETGTTPSAAQSAS
jgi:hypothetical protein